jgi:hypothetical protein
MDIDSILIIFSNGQPTDTVEVQQILKEVDDDPLSIVIVWGGPDDTEGVKELAMIRMVGLRNKETVVNPSNFDGNKAKMIEASSLEGLPLQLEDYFIRQKTMPQSPTQQDIIVNPYDEQDDIPILLEINSASDGNENVVATDVVNQPKSRLKTIITYGKKGVKFCKKHDVGGRVQQVVSKGMELMQDSAEKKFRDGCPMTSGSSSALDDGNPTPSQIRETSRPRWEISFTSSMGSKDGSNDDDD